MQLRETMHNVLSLLLPSSINFVKNLLLPYNIWFNSHNLFFILYPENVLYT
jgi:hypothetical protein